MNLAHEIAIIFMGLGGLFLIYVGEVAAGTGLLGAIGGYAFKNGMKRKPESP